MDQDKAGTMQYGPLPFDLRADQLPDLEISFRVSTTKLLSGFDEIIIRGNGVVELMTAVRRDDTPAVRRGAVDPVLVARLLQLLAAEGMEGWDDHYPAETRDYACKAMTLSLRDDRIKQVAMCQTEFPEFSRAYGAIKLIASLATPEVVRGGFFTRI